MSFQLDLDYIDVAARIVEFRTKHPEGSFQQLSLDFKEVAGKWYVIYTAAAYRTPDDERPGIGTAWEPVPGKTNFTRDSELQNAETAAWGRAIVASLAADTKRGIASAQEVRNRRADQDAPEDAPVVPPVNPVVEARVAVAEAWKANHSGEFDPENVQVDFTDWTNGEHFLEATAARLLEYAEYLAKGQTP
jgi:hypothetical protein